MPKKKLKPIPKFENEDSEREFWATADTTEYFDTDNAIWLMPEDDEESKKNLQDKELGKDED